MSESTETRAPRSRVAIAAVKAGRPDPQGSDGNRADASGPTAAPTVDPSPVEPRVRFNRTSSAGSATFIGSAGASLGLVWVVYQRGLPLSGVLCFLITWYVLFPELYMVMAPHPCDSH